MRRSVERMNINGVTHRGLEVVEMFAIAAQVASAASADWGRCAQSCRAAIVLRKMSSAADVESRANAMHRSGRIETLPLPEVTTRCSNEKTWLVTALRGAHSGSCRFCIGFLSAGRNDLRPSVLLRPSPPGCALVEANSPTEGVPSDCGSWPRDIGRNKKFVALAGLIVNPS